MLQRCVLQTKQKVCKDYLFHKRGEIWLDGHLFTKQGNTIQNFESVLSPKH